MLDDKARLILIMLMRPKGKNANKVFIYTHIWLILSWPYHSTQRWREIYLKDKSTTENMIIFSEMQWEDTLKLFYIIHLLFLI